MSDPIHPVSFPESDSAPTSPGQTMRQAREALGLHIVALAAALKVPVRKLEALEANRWEELTDATFTRALASSVARHLKLDPATILVGLPTAQPVDLNSPIGLGQVGQGVTPVSMAVIRPAQSMPRHSWAIALLLVGTLALYFSPQLPIPAFWVEAVAPSAPETVSATDVPLAKNVTVPVEAVEATPPKQIENSPPAPAPALALAPAPTPTPPPAPAPAPMAPTTVASVAPAPSPSVDVAVPKPVAAAVPAVQSILQLAAAFDTWVEVTDSTKRLRIQRVLKQGEDATFADGAPFAVVVGNASGARVMVRGQPFDLAGIAKNNVARFEVK